LLQQLLLLHSSSYLLRQQMALAPAAVFTDIKDKTIAVSSVSAVTKTSLCIPIASELRRILCVVTPLKKLRKRI